MAELTPTGKAYDRATPGFDVLLNSLQSTTNRIYANRQFAKEVQAREDFAKFQANLNLESEKKRLQELFPIKMEQAREQGELETDLAVDRQTQVGDVRVDQAIDQQDRLFDLEMDNMGERTDAEIAAQNRLESGTRAERVATQKELTDIQKTKEIEVLERRAELQGQEDTTWEVINDMYGDTMDDPAVSVRRPTINPETGEYNPIPVQIGEDIVELNYGQYLSYLETHKNRINLVNKFQDVISNRELTQSNIGNNLGIAGLTEAMNKLQANAYNPQKLQELIQRYSTVSFSFQKNEVQNAVNTAVSEFSALDRLLKPNGGTEYTKMEFDPNAVSEAKVTEWVNEHLVFKNVINTHVEEQNQAILDRISPINESVGAIPGVPNNYGDMVYNWEFDPNADSVDYGRMFISVEEAVNKIRNVKNDDVSSSNRALNIIQQKVPNILQQ